MEQYKEDEYSNDEILDVNQCEIIDMNHEVTQTQKNKITIAFKKKWKKRAIIGIFLITVFAILNISIGSHNYASQLLSKKNYPLSTNTINIYIFE